VRTSEKSSTWNSPNRVWTVRTGLRSTTTFGAFTSVELAWYAAALASVTRPVNVLALWGSPGPAAPEAVRAAARAAAEASVGEEAE